MTTEEFATDLREQVQSGASISDIIELLYNRYGSKYCMPDNINSQEEHDQYLKDVGIKQH